MLVPALPWSKFCAWYRGKQRWGVPQLVSSTVSKEIPLDFSECRAKAPILLSGFKVASAGRYPRTELSHGYEQELVCNMTELKPQWPMAGAHFEEAPLSRGLPLKAPPFPEDCLASVMLLSRWWTVCSWITQASSSASPQSLSSCPSVSFLSSHGALPGHLHTHQILFHGAWYWRQTRAKLYWSIFFLTAEKLNLSMLSLSECSSTRTNCPEQHQLLLECLVQSGQAMA